MTSKPVLDDDAKFALGAISGKLDIIMIQNQESQARNEARFAKIEACQEAQDTRIDSLEQGRSWVLGGAAAITTVVGGIATWLGLR